MRLKSFNIFKKKQQMPEIPPKDVAFEKLLQEVAAAYFSILHDKSAISSVRIEQTHPNIYLFEYVTDKIFTVEKLNNDEVKIDPFDLIIEGEFVIPSNNLVSFFTALAKINVQYLPSPYRKSRKKPNWDKAKEEIEHIVQVYQSKKLNKAINIGLFD
jgi:hypothetical protein